MCCAFPSNPGGQSECEARAARAAPAIKEADMPGWNGWAALGGQLGGGAPVVGRNDDGRLEVFALGRTALGPELVHIWQDPSSAVTGWSDWASLGSPPGQFMSALAVGQNADGRLEVFASATDGAVWHIWQDSGAAGGWSGWGSLGAPAGLKLGTLGVGRDAAGRLELFAIANTGDLWQSRQDPAAAT